MIVGTVGRLMRFPVKSTAGEPLRAAAVDSRGLVGDRRWAVYTADGGMASGKTSRRFRKVEGLLRWRATLPDGADVPYVIAPDGGTYPADDPRAADALSRAFGQPLEPRPETDVSHFDDCGVHLVTTASLRATERLVGGAVDGRRTRANVVLDTGSSDGGEGFVEDVWTGAELALGEEVVLRLGEPMPRCVMVDSPQAGVSADRGILKPLGAAHDVELGLMAEVVRGGTVRVGDAARLLHPARDRV